MQHLSRFVGFLALSFWLPTSQADSSSTLETNQYLVPPIQELPIKDIHYHSQENAQQGHTFEENKYANSRYQLFEVHNPYETSKTYAGIDQIPTDTQPKLAGNFIYLQNTSANQIQLPAQFALDDPNLDVSYLSLTAGDVASNAQIIAQNQIKSDIAVPFPYDYHQIFPEKYQIRPYIENKDPAYLPPPSPAEPEYSTQPTVNYITTHVPQSDYAHAQQNSVYEAPEYLPPPQALHYQQSSDEQDSSHIYQNDEQSNSFKVSDYFPSGYHGAAALPKLSLVSKTQFKGNAYLPPQSHQTLFKGIPYLPPQANYKGPHYLPPDEQAQVTPIQNDGEFLPINDEPEPPFKGPDHLPPHQPQNDGTLVGPELDRLPHAHQHQQLAQILPPGYDFQTPANAEQAIAELHKLPEESEQLQTPNSSTLHEASKQEEINEDFQQKESSGSSYDKATPSSFEVVSRPQHATAQLRDIELSQQNIRSESVPVTHHDFTPALIGFQASLHSFKGPDYLPPFTGSSRYKAPDYLPPGNESYQPTTQTYFRGPDYLPPPTVATNNHQQLNPTAIYPLSFYNVKPSDRYGKKRAFAEYGLSLAKGAKHNAFNALSPMYREPAATTQNYAPAVSYSNSEPSTQSVTQSVTQNIYPSTSALSQQARQALENFMPEDARPASIGSHYHEPTTLEATQQPKFKIRTVQVLNLVANTMKTFKVSESLDHAGVKIIKILGRLDKPPTGSHRVIKVISGSNDASVQTLKIFTDHQDDAPNNNEASDVGQANSYLPPRTKRNSHGQAQAQAKRQ